MGRDVYSPDNSLTSHFQLNQILFGSLNVTVYYMKHLGDLMSALFKIVARDHI